MISRQFILKVDDDTGEAGLQPAWIRDANASSGDTCAHDMLEHIRREPGAAEGELMALGSSYIYRGLAMGYGTFRSTEDNLASSVEDIFMAMFYKGQRLSDPGRTHRLDDDLDESLQYIVDAAMSSWSKEFRHVTDEPDKDPFHFIPYPRCEIKRRMLGWMRRGVRAARRRYRGSNRHEVVSLFMDIAKSSNDFIKEFRDYAEYGPRVTVSACLSTGRVYHRFDNPEFRWLR